MHTFVCVYLCLFASMGDPTDGESVAVQADKVANVRKTGDEPTNGQTGLNTIVRSFAYVRFRDRISTHDLFKARDNQPRWRHHGNQLNYYQMAFEPKTIALRQRCSSPRCDFGPHVIGATRTETSAYAQAKSVISRSIGGQKITSIK